jgi:hypothetical protein
MILLDQPRAKRAPRRRFLYEFLDPVGAGQSAGDVLKVRATDHSTLRGAWRPSNLANWMPGMNRLAFFLAGYTKMEINSPHIVRWSHIARFVEISNGGGK